MVRLFEGAHARALISVNCAIPPPPTLPPQPTVMTSPPLVLCAKGTPNSQRIAILAEYGKMEMAYAAIPEPGPTQVRVKITYVGICGSDLEAYRGSRAPEFMTTPARLGHEVAGVLDKVGDKVVGLRVGDQVTCRYVWGA